jgi:hypothetical protein
MGVVVNQLTGIITHHSCRILPMRWRGGRTVEALDNLRGFIVNGVHPLVPARWVTSRMNVGAVNDLLHVISKNFEGHKVTNSFTDTNPASTVFTTVQRERCVINMVVYWL